MKKEFNFKVIRQLNSFDKKFFQMRSNFYVNKAEIEGFRKLALIAPDFVMMIECFPAKVIKDSWDVIKNSNTTLEDKKACQEFFIDVLRSMERVENEKKMDSMQPTTKGRRNNTNYIYQDHLNFNHDFQQQIFQQQHRDFVHQQNINMQINMMHHGF